MKAWLSRAGVPFVAHNVLADPAAYDALIALGYRRVPLTLVGDQAIAGYRPDALAEALGTAPPSVDPVAP